jgi:hypothetical protein
MAPLARHFSFFGHSGGCVQVELWDAGGARASALLGGASDGQRMASLPAALVALSLHEGGVAGSGFTTAYEALGADALVERLVAEGYELVSEGPETPGSP